jgi:hypothetical protein
MPAPVLSKEALALRIAAAWEEYQRNHVPDNTRRQEFTGAPPVKEMTARSHEMIPELVAKPDRLADEMLLASDEDLVPLRRTYKKTIDLMRGRNRYFAKYTKMATIQPAGNAKLTSTTSQDAIDSRPSCLRSEGGNGTGPDTNRAIGSVSVFVRGDVSIYDFRRTKAKRPWPATGFSPPLGAPRRWRTGAFPLGAPHSSLAHRCLIVPARSWV